MQPRKFPPAALCRPCCLLLLLIQHWGCFHPLRDISATPYWLGQADVAAETYGLNGLKGTFDVKQVPNERLLFFAGQLSSSSSVVYASKNTSSKTPSTRHVSRPCRCTLCLFIEQYLHCKHHV